MFLVNYLDDARSSAIPSVWHSLYDMVHVYAGPYGLACPYVVHPNDFWNTVIARASEEAYDFGSGLLPGRPFKIICRFLGRPPVYKGTSLHRILWKRSWIVTRLNSAGGLVPTPYGGGNYVPTFP